MSTKIPTDSTYDHGFIKRLEPSDGWVAVIAIPSPPYFLVVPLAKWAFVKRDGHDIVEGMIPELGDTSLVSLPHSSIDGEFITYAYVPLQASPLFSEGQTSTFDILTEVARERGKQIAQERAEDLRAQFQVLPAPDSHEELPSTVTEDGDDG